MVFYRIVGALSTIPKGGIYAGLERFIGSKRESYGHEYDWKSFLSHLRSCKVIFLGEIHSVPQITEFQTKVIQALTPPPPPPVEAEDASTNRKLHVVMEHFSFEMQGILDDFASGRMNFTELLRKYSEIGTEGHQLEPYRPLLQHIQASGASRVQLHAGFLSKKFARQVMKEGENAALASAKQWMPEPLTSLEGSTFHYNYFESLLTGRDMHNALAAIQPSDRFRTIFKAQLIKDVAMAHMVSRLISEEPDEDQVVIIAGNGHVQHYQGVPERVLTAHPDLVNRTCLVTSHSVETAELLGRETPPQRLLDSVHLGPVGSNPADFLFFFDGSEEFHESATEIQTTHEPVKEETRAAYDPVKEETRAAYDLVGATAHLQGNLKRAHAIMQSLGYSQDDIQVAGTDAYNFQGVGNPHKHAHIQAGETILDIGSGLGVDSFIAAEKAEPHGRVNGIDLASKEVSYAQLRAQERGLDNIQFMTADMERMPFPDNSFDVVISNGAFCLAPDKEKAFTEVYRVLKPGGRMAICTSTLQTEEVLEENVTWPVCMRMFISKNLLKPLCERIGFSDVVVDDSDSEMVFELPLQEDEAALNPKRHRVHGESGAFTHLENYDMNKLCARVVVVATKEAPVGR